MVASKTAVLAIEFQNEFTTKGGKLHSQARRAAIVLAKLPKLGLAVFSAACRQHGCCATIYRNMLLARGIRVVAVPRNRCTSLRPHSAAALGIQTLAPTPPRRTDAIRRFSAPTMPVAKRHDWLSTLEDADVANLRARCSKIIEGADAKPYNRDWMNKWEGQARIVAQPATTEEVSAVLAYCDARRLAVTTQGGKTGLVGGSVPVHDEVILSTTRLNEIDSLDADSMGFSSRFLYDVSGNYGADLFIVDTSNNILGENEEGSITKKTQHIDININMLKGSIDNGGVSKEIPGQQTDDELAALFAKMDFYTLHAQPNKENVPWEWTWSISERQEERNFKVRDVKKDDFVGIVYVNRHSAPIFSQLVLQFTDAVETLEEFEAQDIAQTLRRILGKEAQVTQQSDHKVALLNCRLPFPVDVRAVRQAMLAANRPRATLRVDDKKYCFLELPLETDENCYADEDSAEEPGVLPVPEDDVEYDLSYCDNNSGIKQIIQALYSLCHGIKVYADRRNCTESTCCLIVDNVRTMYMDAFSRALLDNMSHFIVSMNVVGSKRLRIQARLLGSKKRKRT